VEGTVESFSGASSCGWIRGRDGTEYYFRSDGAAFGVGDRVVFIAELGPGGWQAVKVLKENEAKNAG